MDEEWTNDDLARLILPWAKAERPKEYGLTLEVARDPTRFRAYMLRLIELRCEADQEWMLTVPLRLLELTSLRRRWRIRGTDRVIEIAGSRAEGAREWSWAELADLLEVSADLAAVARTKATLDLEIDDRRPGTWRG